MLADRLTAPLLPSAGGDSRMTCGRRAYVPIEWTSPPSPGPQDLALAGVRPDGKRPAGLLPPSIRGSSTMIGRAHHCGSQNMAMSAHIYLQMGDAEQSATAGSMYLSFLSSLYALVIQEVQRLPVAMDGLIETRVLFLGRVTVDGRNESDVQTLNQNKPGRSPFHVPIESVSVRMCFAGG